ncbi:MAG: flavin reductase (DIM6/NTAB) family NADH-FMN oxidoreductase RutF [Bacteroidia bacterium]|jgi:flavin reductase (DIM6/NTAB) family NADH-FMN oxidoreductase RutF
MVSLDPKELPIPKLHHILLGGIGPRPICFASTVDEKGNRNLSPFSFFNVFSANPPILVFSPARSGRTGATKNTFDNCKATKEVVVNVVNYSMVQQMSLSSSPYPKGVDEFVKAGFTPLNSDVVAPARVQESPVQLECKVIEIKELGKGGGAGNLIICEIVKIHLNENVLLEDGNIDQQKIDLVARMGGNFYCRANGDALFEIPKPITSIGIGVDALPAEIRSSKHLSGNQLGMLGMLEEFPIQSEIDSSETFDLSSLLKSVNDHLDRNQSHKALCMLLKNSSIL